jgi:hypothetical protein
MSEYPFDPNFLPDNLRHIRSIDEPIACPIGEALWLEYRKRNPNGLTLPHECPEDYPDPELAEYFTHVNGCDNCNEV